MEILLDTLKWSVIVGVLALVLAVLRPALEKRYSARWRYWLWLALAVLALLAPVQWERLVPSAPAVHTPVVIDVPEMELQVIQGERVSVALRPVDSALENIPAQRMWRLAEVLPVLWMGGAAAFVLYTLAGTWYFRHKARRWSRTPGENTQRIYETIWRDMGLEKAPPLYVSSAARSPVLTGLLAPCLLLPNETWNERELSFILRHELTHYKRRDLWYKLVLLAANALHWFNPLLYLLVREASVDMELTCDDEVVFGESQETRRAYSETLLSAVRRSRGPGTSLSTNFYGGKAVMKERFRNILGKWDRKWGAAALVLALLATLVSACTFGLRQTDTGTILSNPATVGPVQDETHTGAPQEYINNAIASLAQNGVSVTDQRSSLTLVDSFRWDVFDSDVEVWKLEYDLILEGSDSGSPAGLSESDSPGGPYFITSVYKGEEPYTYQLLETAYLNHVKGFTWEEYACCHSVFGLELFTPGAGGWPETSDQFILSLLNGRETWALNWEDVAASYLAAQGEDPSLEWLSTTCRFEGSGANGEAYAHDEGRLVSFLTASGRTGMMLLVHISAGDGAAGEAASFWQVAGILWHDGQ